MDKTFVQCAGCLVNRAQYKLKGGPCRLLSMSSSKSHRKKNHYQTLNVGTSATPEQIRTAFIQLSKTVHPDLNPNDPTNHSKFVQLNEAYTTLSKASARREYDFTLAHRMYYEDNLKRHGYSSHTSGGSYTPGSGTARDQGFESQQGAFWDETIWYMRDKSRDKDAFYPEDSYYGVKGVRRLPNSYVIAGCLGLVLIGTISFLLCFKYSYKKSQQYLEIQQRKNHETYLKARENALKYTTAEQLQRLFVPHPEIRSTAKNMDDPK